VHSRQVDLARHRVSGLLEDAVNEEVRAQLRSLRSSIARLHAIEHALDAERDETLWLN
jgi:hypothetical protein